MTLNSEALEKARAWFDAQFNGLPDTETLTAGIVSAYLSALPSGDELVERLHTAVALGTKMGARGQHPSNIFNLAAEAATRIQSLMAEVERVTGERDEAKEAALCNFNSWKAAVEHLVTAEARVKVLEEGFRDKIALGASEADILRFRDGYPNPAGGSKILYRYSIEQARYRYADAMFAARTLKEADRNE